MRILSPHQVSAGNYWHIHHHRCQEISVWLNLAKRCCVLLYTFLKMFFARDIAEHLQTIQPFMTRVGSVNKGKSTGVRSPV